MPYVPADSIEKLVAKVADLFRDAEARLLVRLAESVAAGIDSPHWVEEQTLRVARYRRHAEQVLEELRREIGEVTGDSVLRAAMRGQAAALADLTRVLTPADGMGRTVDTEAVVRLAAELTTTTRAAATPILRVTDDAYRQVIASVAHRSIIGEATQRQAAQEALDQFASRGITSFVGRTGRRMRIEHYVEMTTRASLMNAAIQGHIDRLQDLGMRLVVVSDVPQECRRCRPWEGKTLALDDTGTVTVAEGKRVRVDGTLTEARRAGLFHPGCRHSISAWRPDLRSFGETSDPEGDRARQTLRRLERELRAAKREQLVALDDAARRDAGRKVAGYQARIREHVAATSAKRQRHREQITGAYKPATLGD